MQLGPEHFKANAQAALADRTLKIAIERTTGTAVRKRAEAVAEFPEFDAARQRGRRIKDHVIANLDHYLEMFERNAVAAGSRVYWAATADEARDTARCSTSPGEWRRSVRERLPDLSITTSNRALAKARGVSETAIRKAEKDSSRR